MEFDSFLTIGMDGPALQSGTLSTIGIDLADWTEQAGINSDNGAVFFMDPLHGATTQPCVFAQLTVRAGSRFQGRISAQGKTVGGGEDWIVVGLEFTEAGGAAPSRPPPPPPPPSAPAGYPRVTCQQSSSSKDGYDTYIVAVEFDPDMMLDVYALYGEEGDPLIFPPAFQVDPPFGSDVGPVSLRPCVPARRFPLANARPARRQTRRSSPSTRTPSSTRS